MPWPFKCKHPFDSLKVLREQVVSQPTDYPKDFERVSYHFLCADCGKELVHEHARCMGGAKDFMDRTSP